MAPEERTGSLSDISVTTHSSQQSRSSSPSRPSEAQYRGGPLRRANIFVDEDIPMDVSAKLWGKSKELVKKPSGEAEWTDALYTAIDDLRPPGLDIARNRDWREDLRPPVHNPLPTIPRKRTQSHQPLPGNTATDRLYPSPHASHAVAVEPTIPVFKLKDPRPDICVGLSDKSLASALEPTKGRSVARSLLHDLQDTSSLISDPHITPLDLRFPFLIVEAKAGATGGNLYNAQNQAAVGGSTALQIFKNLSDLSEESQSNIQEPTEALSDVKFNLAFSVTTEGPIHEFWLHFQRPEEEDFCMVCLGTWRTTLKDGSLSLLRHLLAVLRWGNGELKDNIISVLQDL